MSNSSKKIIAVTGATGAQGGGVVRALQEGRGYIVRALTRNPSKAAGLADEVIEADFDRPETLRQALEGAMACLPIPTRLTDPPLTRLPRAKPWSTRQRQRV